MAQPVIARRKPGDLAKLPGEVVAVGEPNFKRDLRDPFVRVTQQTAGALDPLADQPGERGGAGGRLEDPQETPSRHVPDDLLHERSRRHERETGLTRLQLRFQAIHPTDDLGQLLVGAM